MSIMKITQEKADLLSLDTPWDRLVHRPPAKIIAKILSKTRVRPNQVTLMTLIPAAFSAWSFSRGKFISGVWGLVFFYLWAMLDHVDGELSRLTGQTSAFGQKLDDSCDDISSTVILIGIFYGLLCSIGPANRPWLGELFLLGIVLDKISGALVLRAKRRVRVQAIEARTVTPRFVFVQKILDHFTGRDPFYLLIFTVLLALFWHGLASRVVLSLLIAGCYASALISLTAWLRMRASD